MLPGIAGLAGLVAARGTGFVDDFTGPSGQLLVNRPGWTLGFGRSDALYLSGNRLAFVNNNPVVYDGYYDEDGNYQQYSYQSRVEAAVFREDDGSTDQIVQADFFAIQDYSLVTFGSGSSPNTFSGYRFSTENGDQRSIIKVVNGQSSSLAFFGGYSSVYTPAFRMRATVTSQYTAVECYNGDTLIASVNDAAADRLTSGRRGIYMAGQYASDPVFDNYSDNGPS